MIQTVADQVSQRVGDTLDQALVQFGRLAGGFQFNMLAQLAGQVAHHTGETGEHEGNRHHADGHDRFLQIAGIAFQLGQTIHQPLRGAFLHLRRCLQQHGLGNHQLANQVDQLVDFFDTDPDRRIAPRGCGRAGLACPGPRLGHRFFDRLDDSRRERLDDDRRRFRNNRGQWREETESVTLLGHCRWR